jgi:hypothetical protein
VTTAVYIRPDLDRLPGNPLNGITPTIDKRIYILDMENPVCRFLKVVLGLAH